MKVTKIILRMKRKRRRRRKMMRIMTATLGLIPKTIIASCLNATILLATFNAGIESTLSRGRYPACDRPPCSANDIHPPLHSSALHVAIETRYCYQSCHYLALCLEDIPHLDQSWLGLYAWLLDSTKVCILLEFLQWYELGLDLGFHEGGGGGRDVGLNPKQAIPYQAFWFGGGGKTTKCTDRNKWMSKNKMSSLSPKKNKEEKEDIASCFFLSWWKMEGRGA